jgi:hypothetical protein
VNGGWDAGATTHQRREGKHPSADWQLEVAHTPLRALDIVAGRDIEQPDCGAKLEKVNAN